MVHRSQIIYFIIKEAIFFQLSLQQLPNIIILHRCRITNITLQKNPSIFIHIHSSHIKRQCPCGILHGTAQTLSVIIHSYGLMKTFHIRSMRKFFAKLSQRFQKTGNCIKPFFRTHTMCTDPSD